MREAWGSRLLPIGQGPSGQVRTPQPAPDRLGCMLPTKILQCFSADPKPNSAFNIESDWFVRNFLKPTDVVYSRYQMFTFYFSIKMNTQYSHIHRCDSWDGQHFRYPPHHCKSGRSQTACGGAGWGWYDRNPYQTRKGSHYNFHIYSSNNTTHLFDLMFNSFFAE